MESSGVHRREKKEAGVRVSSEIFDRTLDHLSHSGTLPVY